MRYSYSSRNFLGKTCHNSCVLVYIVYFDCILNEKMFFFQIEIMISAAHMLGGMLPCETILEKCAI